MLVAVVGATATGKSDLAVTLARALDGEVVNADSMQLYRGMDIGTAKLSVAERQGIPHHLLDVWDVTKTASVAEYQVLASEVIADIEARGKVPVLAGGSGLYVRAALGDLAFPGTDERIRSALEAELAAPGPGPLHLRLTALDPAAAAAILPSNGRRIVRVFRQISLDRRWIQSQKAIAIDSSEEIEPPDSGGELFSCQHYENVHDLNFLRPAFQLENVIVQAGIAAAAEHELRPFIGHDGMEEFVGIVFFHPLLKVLR